MKYLKLYIHTALLFLYILWPSANRPAYSEEKEYTLRVGVILALSGEAATQGNNIKNGIELGLSELEPDLREKIQVVYEDDQLVPKNTAAAFQKLTRGSEVDLVVNSSAPNRILFLSLSQEHNLSDLF